MAQYKTPGVYVVEKNAFPNSVVEVATAVPAFIGYTESADNKGTSLARKPWRISSMAEFNAYYGGAPKATFTVADKDPDPDIPGDFSVTDITTNVKSEYTVAASSTPYILYYSMLLFFQNGGGACYIVSVGKYGEDLAADRFTAGIDALLKEQEPTMVVIPEAVYLNKADCASVQQAVLMHCGLHMRNRFAILDVYDGYKDRHDPAGDCVGAFRDSLGTNFLHFGAAYYPWVNTSIIKDNHLDFTHITNIDKLAALLALELAPILTTANPSPIAKARIDQLNTALAGLGTDWSKEPDSTQKIEQLNKTLAAVSSVYAKVLRAMQKRLNLLPPSSSMAGVYTLVDNTRGVWKAPANFSLNGVVSPAVNITNEDQEDINVTTQGKSINAIRSFMGEGVLVWGARTLDGNSLDWRYINVRRTMIMIQESVRNAIKAHIFEPNVANTWITLKSMIHNFLTSVWKRGGLAGATPDEAFSVFVGLGETMTADDILEGIMKVSVLVAISRPAEFIEIIFEQQMQKS